MRYPVIISDIGGVIVHFDTDRLVQQVSQLVHRSFDEVQGVIYHKELLLPFELGRMAPRAYYDGLTQRLALPWTYEQFVRVWNDIFTENQEMAQIIERLRVKHRLVALTNTNLLHLAHLKSSIPTLSLFESVIASCEVGFYKPERQMYTFALEQAGVQPHEAIYIDDRPELVEAGRSLGLMGIRFESGQQLEHDLRQLGLNF